jgi:formate hydrogenlyase subunit 3/multisubunit Na+/H+ antiporter MnhD subunit
LIKIGIYAIARSLFTLAPELFAGALQTPLLFVAAISMLVGGFQMLQQQSIKRILAFSSVSQMGYALMGLAIGTPLSLAGAAMHLVHHALVKSALFMGAGVVTWRANIHTLEEGGGLARKMPFTLAVFLLGGLSLSGIPFFSGYISKTILEEAAFEAGFRWLAYAAIFASILTFCGVGRLVWYVFFSKKSVPGLATGLAPSGTPVPASPGEAPLLAIIPMLALVIGFLWVGIIPGRAAASLVWPAALSLDETEQYVSAVLETGQELPSTRAEMEDGHVPIPADWHHWLSPAVVLAAGSLFLYWIVARDARGGRQDERDLRSLLSQLAARASQWHSGIVNDYALWTAFGTAFLLMILFVITRLSPGVP